MTINSNVTRYTGLEKKSIVARSEGVTLSQRVAPLTAPNNIPYLLDGGVGMFSDYEELSVGMTASRMRIELLESMVLAVNEVQEEDEAKVEIR